MGLTSEGRPPRAPLRYPPRDPAGIWPLPAPLRYPPRDPAGIWPLLAPLRYPSRDSTGIWPLLARPKGGELCGPIVGCGCNADSPPLPF